MIYTGIVVRGREDLVGRCFAHNSVRFDMPDSVEPTAFLSVDDGTIPSVELPTTAYLYSEIPITPTVRFGIWFSGPADDELVDCALLTLIRAEAAVVAAVEKKEDDE